MKKEDLIRFYSNFKSYIFPSVVAISSLFLIIFAIYPQATKLISNRQSVKDLISKTDLLETKVTALESYNEADLSREVGFVLASLPAEKDLGNIFGLLQQIIGKSGFSISAVSIGNTSGKQDNVDSYEVKLEITGTKALMTALLDDLESSVRLIRINSIDVLSGQPDKTNALLVLKVLYSPVPKNFGAIDSPLPQLTQKDEELLAKLAQAGFPGGSSGTQPSSPKGKSDPFE